MRAVTRRLLLRCELCASDSPDGVLVEATTHRAIVAAVDHFLDHHRAELLFDHQAALRSIHVDAPKGPFARTVSPGT